MSKIKMIQNAIKTGSQLFKKTAPVAKPKFREIARFGKQGYGSEPAPKAVKAVKTVGETKAGKALITLMSAGMAKFGYDVHNKTKAKEAKAKEAKLKMAAAKAKGAKLKANKAVKK